LTACLPEDKDEDATTGEPIRSVKTQQAEARPATQLRRFPSVLEPPQLVTLAFEVGGRVETVDLDVGQVVAADELLATIEPVDLDLQLQQAQAALVEARAAATNARDEANRQQTLFERGVVSEAATDRTEAQAEQAEARLDQAQSNLALLQKTRSDAELRAPFAGVINAVEVEDFASVQAGQPILTLYEDGDLQASILVSYEVASALSVGDSVLVVPADGFAEPIEAHVTEIGRRAPAVSSFPVVVTLDEATETLRSGMAVEIQVDLDVSLAPGLIPLPLSALATNRPARFSGQPPFEAEVFVFTATDGTTGTLTAQPVSITAAAEDYVFVSDGISVGDIIVTGGVPFLRDGQTVRLQDSTPGAEQ